MSLAVTIDLDARSPRRRAAGWGARALVVASLLIATLHAGRALLDAPPPDTPGAAHHAGWRVPAIVALGVGGCLLWSWWLRRKPGAALATPRTARRASAALPPSPPAAIGASLSPDRPRPGPPALSSGQLLIDAAGAASWRSDRRATPLPLALHDSYLGPTLISLRFVPGGDAVATGRQAAAHLLLMRDAVSADQWRRLRVWALWRQRGGRDGVVL